MAVRPIPTGREALGAYPKRVVWLAVDVWRCPDVVALGCEAACGCSDDVGPRE